MGTLIATAIGVYILILLITAAYKISPKFWAALWQFIIGLVAFFIIVVVVAAMLSF